MHLFEEACERFKTHRARIGLIGLGYAGLPLACLFAQTGFKVTGFDIDDQKVQS